MRRLVRVVNAVCDISGQLGAWLVVVMMALVIVSVMSRYVMHDPLLFGDEFSAYMLVALSFLGLAYTWKEGGHIRVDVVVRLLPPRVSKWLRAITLMIAAAFCIMLSMQSYGFVALSFQRGLRSNSWLATPLQGPHLTVSVGFTLLALLLIVETVRAFLAVSSTGGVEEKPR